MEDRIWSKYAREKEIQGTTEGVFVILSIYMGSLMAK